jgi:hypothetical protein
VHKKFRISCETFFKTEINTSNKNEKFNTESSSSRSKKSREQKQLKKLSIEVNHNENLTRPPELCKS